MVVKQNQKKKKKTQTDPSPCMSNFHPLQDEFLTIPAKLHDPVAPFHPAKYNQSADCEYLFVIV
jgi:hypothetical protein